MAVAIGEGAPSDAYWLEVSVTTDGEAAEALSAVLDQFAYQRSVVMEQMGDPLDPDPEALEDEVRVKIYLPGHADTGERRRTIEEAIYYLSLLYPIPEPQFRKIAAEEWSTSWREHFKPFRIGRRLWIQPSWQQVDRTDPDALVVELDPGMAFGTGLHPSTRMCAEVLEDLIQSGSSLLDIGTGSGILAIAGVGYGADRILALDIDGQAVRAAMENVRRNEVSEVVQLVQGPISSIGFSEWDVIVVNILAPVIKTLLQAGLLRYLSPDGAIVLSGIIEDQSQEIRRSIEDAGGRILKQLQQGDWITLVAAR